MFLEKISDVAAADDSLTTSAIVSLLGSMGASGAAVFAMWFLTTKFSADARQNAQDARQDRIEFIKVLTDLNTKVYELARESAMATSHNGDAIIKVGEALLQVNTTMNAIVSLVERLQPAVLAADGRPVR